MTTPRRGLLFHFTHVDNLPSVITHGLRSDTAVRAEGSLAVEVGEDRIKEQRREGAMWNNTAAEPDRMERRMAEFLVYGSMPFSAVMAVGVRSEVMAATVTEVLGTLDAPPKVLVRPDWYF